MANGVIALLGSQGSSDIGQFLILPTLFALISPWFLWQAGGFFGPYRRDASKTRNDKWVRPFLLVSAFMVGFFGGGIAFGLWTLVTYLGGGAVEFSIWLFLPIALPTLGLTLLALKYREISLEVSND
ncbi:MAG: hypothetical protein AAF311_05200 [Pseudomonadota bacterium]